METIRVRVENGNLIGKAPAGLPEGMELELRLADPGDDLTQEELEELNRTLEAARRSLEAGKVQPARDTVSDIRKG